MAGQGGSLWQEAELNLPGVGARWALGRLPDEARGPTRGCLLPPRPGPLMGETVEGELNG